MELFFLFFVTLVVFGNLVAMGSPFIVVAVALTIEIIKGIYKMVANMFGNIYIKHYPRLYNQLIKQAK